jgi:hypothetical protein
MNSFQNYSPFCLKPPFGEFVIMHFYSELIVLLCEMSIPYAGDAGILLPMKGELTVGKVKSSRLS